jgi:alpha,alpha-trehalase
MPISRAPTLDHNVGRDMSPSAMLFPSAEVYNNPAILAAFHNSHPGPRDDSKVFVDRSLTKPPNVVLAAFQALRDRIAAGPLDWVGSSSLLVEFFLEHFAPDPESAAVPFVPVDFAADHVPDSFSHLASGKSGPLEFAMALKAIWPELCRVTPKVPTSYPYDQSSLIPLPHPFFIAGGRFREVYYWDTYWIVKGLLASDMPLSARLSVENLLYMVKVVGGFVPNGNRVYYLNRSQPPMLTLSAHLVLDHDACQGIVWLEQILPLLDLEYEVFVSAHSVPQASLPEASALSMYRASSHRPRPESWVEDCETAQVALASKHSLPISCAVETPFPFGFPDAPDFYLHITSAAESGFDFSSRWFASQTQGFPSTQTASIIPVCLNSILFATECSLAHFHFLLSTRVRDRAVAEKHDTDSKKYAKAAEARASAINRWLWNPEKEIWCDYNIAQGKLSHVVAASGLYPLWAGCWPKSWATTDAIALVQRCSTSGLVQVGGISATTNFSGQQWDSPNSWPPLADIAVSGFERLEKSFPGCGAGSLASCVAEATLRSMHRGWVSTGAMHEKYDASASDGRRGTGGEYEPQCGFGWTNGVALDFMRRGYWYSS